MNYTEGLELNQVVRAGMNVIEGDEYKEAFTAVSNCTAEILKKTLGPFAHTTVIDDGQFTYSTKDGWNIVNRLRFGEPLYNTLYGFIRNISYSLVSKVGDGTTTAIIAANEFIKAISDAPELAHYRQRDVLETINVVKDEIIAQIKSSKYLHAITPANDYEDIYRIAYTSSNGNEQIASIIRKIYMETNNPNIYINPGPEKETSYEIHKGYRLDCFPKLLNAYINTDSREYKCTENTLVFFCNHNMTYTEHRNIIVAISSYCTASNSSCIIFAPYFDDILSGVIRDLVDNMSKNRQIPNIMMVQIPMSMSIQKDYVSDAAMLCRAKIFDGGALRIYQKMRNGETLEENENDSEYEKDLFAKYQTPDALIQDYCGIIPAITVNEKFVNFENYSTEKYPLFENTFKAVETAYKNALDKSATVMTALNKEFMDISMRYTRLVGFMGMINVGGDSELEKMCLKDSVDDAVLACRSAFENGYVKGMNLATIGAIHDLLVEAFTKEDNERIAFISDGTHTTAEFVPSQETELRKLILVTLHRVYKEVAWTVMHNKYPDATKSSLIWKMDPDAQNLGTVIPATECSGSAVIDYCTTANKGFNLVTETYEQNDQLSVINSVVTDVEVLNATISILTYVLTSNQLLSINRTYDKSVQKNIAEIQMKNKYHLIAKEIVDVVKEENLFPALLQAVNPRGVWEPICDGVPKFMEDAQITPYQPVINSGSDVTASEYPFPTTPLERAYAYKK